MRKIIDYKTVWAENTNELDALVRQAIADGYEPIGCMLFNENNGKAFQTMVKYEEAEQLLNE